MALCCAAPRRVGADDQLEALRDTHRRAPKRVFVN